MLRRHTRAGPLSGACGPAGPGDSVNVDCTPIDSTANGDSAAAVVGADSEIQTVAMQLTETFASQATITIQCFADPRNPSASDTAEERARITAIKVGSETH